MIFEVLSEGEVNAITSAELSKLLNRDTREISELVRSERLSGAPICSGSKGYYKPKNKDELKKTVSRLYKQAREIRKSAEAMKNCVDKYIESDELEYMASAMSTPLIGGGDDE